MSCQATFTVPVKSGGGRGRVKISFFHVFKQGFLFTSIRNYERSKSFDARGNLALVISKVRVKGLVFFYNGLKGIKLIKKFFHTFLLFSIRCFALLNIIA